MIMGRFVGGRARVEHGELLAATRLTERHNGHVAQPSILF